MAPRFFVETLGCPKNAVDSDKVVASLLADGLTPVERGRGRRPDRGQHVCVRRGGPAGVDRHCPGAGRREASRRPAGRHRLHGRALRHRARRGAARGGRGRRLRGGGEPLPGRAHGPQAVRGPGPARAAPARADHAVGLREGGRGLRPGVCVLRDPVVPRQAAVALDRLDRSRGARRSSTAGVAEIVLVAQDLAWYGRDIGEPGSLAPLLRRLDRLAPRGLARRAAALPLPERGPRPAALDDARARDGRPVLRPLAAARVGAVAAEHEAVGQRRPVRRPHRAHPRERVRGRVPLVVHRRVPRRDRSRTTTSCSAFLREVRLDWAGFFPFSAEDGTPAATLRRADPRRTSRPSGCASAASCRTRSRRRRATRSSARRSRCSSTGSTPTPATLVGRTHREAPEIDGIVRVTGDAFARPGALVVRARHRGRGPGPRRPRHGGGRARARRRELARRADEAVRAGRGRDARRTSSRSPGCSSRSRR